MRGVALAVLLLGASAAPASAGFRYVPPAQTEASAEPADKGPGEAGARRGTARMQGAGVPHEKVEPAPGPGHAVSGTSVWRVHAGETLRDVLARWGARTGADVVFLTDRRYRLEVAASFGGGFGEAVRTLFAALAHLPHPPKGALSADGGSLVVTHRAPAAHHGGTVP